MVDKAGPTRPADKMSEEKGKGRRVTLASVAQAAGVSLPTVSKVVNGHPDVAPQTRVLIERLLLQHEYVPRQARRTNSLPPVLDLAFDRLDSWYSLEIVRGVTEAAREAGADVVVAQTPADPTGQAWSRKLATAGRVGLILVTSTLTVDQWRHFHDARVPVVVIDPVEVPDDSVPSIGATNWAGGVAATEHLLQLGHRRIATVVGRPQSFCGRARLHGYRAALDAAGVEADPELVRYGDFGFEKAYEGALELLDLPDRPTAIFATSDFQAFGVVEAARVRSLRVPQDLSVVGFDDLSISRWAAPPLTTVRQPLVRMGRVACQTLLRLAAGESLESDRMELATQLVVRESTTPPRGL